MGRDALAIWNTRFTKDWARAAIALLFPESHPIDYQNEKARVFMANPLVATLYWGCSESDRPRPLFDGESLANWEIRNGSLTCTASRIKNSQGLTHIPGESGRLEFRKIEVDLK